MTGGRESDYQHWDGASLERKIRAAGRPWTIGDILAVGDEGQWAVGVESRRRERAACVAEVLRRAQEAGQADVSLNALIRAAGLEGLDDADREEREGGEGQ